MGQAISDWILKQHFGDVSLSPQQEKGLPSWELTYPFPKHFWVDDFPFTEVGYISSLECNHGDGKSPKDRVVGPSKWASFGL